MARYRDALPQLNDNLFLTDGGIETALIYQHGFELPEFAAFVLLDSQRGREALSSYLRGYADVAAREGTGFVLETATYRASADWARKIGFSRGQVADFNRRAIDLLCDIRREYEDRIPHMVISGCLGPRGDGYNPTNIMTPEEAEAYHGEQIATFADTEADLVTAHTIPYVEEAVGIARAARSLRMPSVISFTLETDGRLPSGQGLREAIERVELETDGAPAYYMTNCAHPTHFMDVLSGDGWLERIRAVRANASLMSHAELEQAEELDDGDPVQFGREHVELRGLLPNLNIFGGCCGTDHRHVDQVSRAVLAAAA